MDVMQENAKRQHGSPQCWCNSVFAVEKSLKMNLYACSTAKLWLESDVRLVCDSFGHL
jgi:hypothetical protein